MDTKKYSRMTSLLQSEKIDEDYKIEVQNRKSLITIFAPHGGHIEQGTTQLAKLIAGNNYNFYSFIGLNKDKLLHITSTAYNEPIIKNLLLTSLISIAIHGCRGDEPIIYFGGKNKPLRNFLATSAFNSGFKCKKHLKLKGEANNNITNDPLFSGAQIEITRSLRKSFFTSFKTENEQITKLGLKFIEAIKSGIYNYSLYLRDKAREINK